MGECCNTDDERVCQWMNVVTLMVNRYASG